MKKRYSEEQIIKAIKQHEAGAKVDDICREMGISSGTFYNWRSKYAGLEVNEAKRLKELESENNKLKKMLADKLLEVEAMKDVLSKKWYRQQQESLSPVTLLMHTSSVNGLPASLLVSVVLHQILP